MSRVALALAVVLGVAVWWWQSSRSGQETHERGAETGADRQKEAARREQGDDELRPIQVGRVQIELLSEPVSAYGLDTGDRGYRGAVERVHAGAFDANLSRAAGEYAAQSVVLGSEPSDRVMSFLLHSAGAPDFTAGRYIVTTTDETDEALDEALREATRRLPAGPGRLVIGVGESFNPASRRPRRIAVLVARRFLDIDEGRRLIQAGRTWSLRGRLHVKADSLSASVLLPNGELADATVEASGKTFAIRVPVGTQTGTLWLSIDGRHPERGPFKLAQLSVEVGDVLPRTRTITIPPEEEWTDPRAAEAYVAELINRDRAALGLRQLSFDPELAAIARSHSIDMRESGYFGHVSPTTGSVGDRLARATYPAASYAENLARNDRVAEAHASLMWSVGHRKNLVSDRFDRVGVGVARRDNAGTTDWYVTEVFAKRSKYEDPQRVRTVLLQRINRARAGAQLPNFLERQDLVARVEQFLADGAGAAEDAQGLANELGPHLPGGAQIVLFSTTDPDEVELPAAIEDEHGKELVLAVVAGRGVSFIVAIIITAG